VKRSKKIKQKYTLKKRSGEKIWESTIRGELKRKLGRGKTTKGSSEDSVYNFVCKNPGLCTYDIQKRLKMSGGRVRHALSQLNKHGLVKFRFVCKSPRVKKLSYPVEAWKLVPGGLKRAVKKIAGRENSK